MSEPSRELVEAAKRWEVAYEARDQGQMVRAAVEMQCAPQPRRYDDGAFQRAHFDAAKVIARAELAAEKESR